jgi:hypothetical protein
VRDRLRRAVDDREFDAPIDVDGLARFVFAVQGGMSLMARDGASKAELEAVARHTMSGWDNRAFVQRDNSTSS